MVDNLLRRRGPRDVASHRLRQRERVLGERHGEADRLRRLNAVGEQHSLRGDARRRPRPAGGDTLQSEPLTLVQGREVTGLLLCPAAALYAATAARAASQAAISPENVCRKRIPWEIERVNGYRVWYTVFMKVSPAQSRAGRGLLDWSQITLGARANLSESTIRDFEKGRRVPSANNVAAIRRALETAGVIFVDENGEGPGVRLRKARI